MAERVLSTLLEGGSFFEGPRWRDGTWFVSDFYRGLVSSVSPDGKARTVLEIANQPSGLGWLPDGSLLVVSMIDRRILRQARDGTVVVHADLANSAEETGNLNDMVVDRHGRAYVGCMGRGNVGLERNEDPTPAPLFRVDLDGTVTVAADQLLFPNGCVIDPSGQTLIVGETQGYRYTAFTILDDGSLSERRVWADLAAEEVAADGCCLDEDGCIWSSDPKGGRWVLIREGGAIIEEISAPEGHTAIACMLGGADGRSLLLVAQRQGAPRRERPLRRDSVLFCTRVDVPHAGLP